LRDKSGFSQTDVARLITEMTGETKSWVSIRDYEVRNLGIPFKFLRALAEVYGADVRDLILVSNQTRFPNVPRDQWLLRDYPIYIENQSDLERLQHYRDHDAGTNSLGWLIYTARKDPLRYLNTVEVQERSGMSGNELSALEMNRDYPTPRLLAGLSATLDLTETSLLDAANRTFHPTLRWQDISPGNSIYIQSHSQDALKIAMYAQYPGSPGQQLFAYRKALPGYPSAKELGPRLGYSEQFWGKMEWNRPPPDLRNRETWQRLFESLRLPMEGLQYWIASSRK
jgi:transcriptional regulator with XRE-family HTH domain